MLARFILTLACVLGTYFIIDGSYGFPWSLGGLLLGLLLALFIIKIEQILKKIPLGSILGGTGGMMVGLLIALLLVDDLSFGGNKFSPRVIPWLCALLTVVMGYLGLVLGAAKVAELNYWGGNKAQTDQDVRILDTSVIIDGRIADVCDAGFMRGVLMVPRFVLEELQYVADASDSIRRSRGRRGLDILNRMQKSTGIKIEIVDQDFPKIKAVDAKLVALAKQLNGKIVTNDFNLNKVAELQGVGILNINLLANAMKPVVLPGEMMTVKIIKEGKEPGQGVAYLDDGTMIIVENAQKYQGTTVIVTVTSVLQTTAGRMIFSEFKETVGEREAPSGSDKG